MRSYSKRAGFTGVRCAYTVVPKAVTGVAASGERVPLHALWARRMSTKFNGVPYVIQRAAEAVHSPDGRKQTAEQVAYYMENARRLREGLAPPASASSAACTRRTSGCACRRHDVVGLLRRAAHGAAHVVGTPGAGFGPAGEGYLRLSAFNSHANVEEALTRIRAPSRR
jgi:LL-diaminopimelate aminotransferase